MAGKEQMREPDDEQLLARYNATGAQDAFRLLVERHTAMVYGICRRGLSGDAHLANDATQAVFIVLARKAKGIRTRGMLIRLLLKTSRFVVSNIRRDRARRKRREEEAAVMAEQQRRSAEEVSWWTHIQEYLDEEIARLPRVARDAVVLHFLRGMPRRAVAAELGCSAAALDKRLYRALETLRIRLGRYGTAVSGGMLAAYLGECAAEAAPAPLVAAAQAAALGSATGSAATSVAAALARGAIRMMNLARLKTAAAIVAGVAVACAGGAGALKYVAATREPAAAVIDRAPQPHLKRAGRNLIRNAAVIGTTGWTLTGDAVYDAGLSRAAGSGSLRLTSPYRWEGDGPDPDTSRALANWVPVTPGRVYTFSLYMRSTHVPRWLTLRIDHLDGDRKRLKTAEGHYRFEQQTCGNSVAQRWEEAAMEFRASARTHYAEIKLFPWVSEDNTGHVWADDFYFGEGTGFEQPPSPKSAFAGSRVRVDALGNYEVKRNGEWVPFFLWGVFNDHARDDFSVYSAQGWNCVMRAQSVQHLKKCAAAKSAFNPDGMLGCVEISGYVNPEHGVDRGLTQLDAGLRDIETAGLTDRIFAYYWNNGNACNVWQPNIEMVAAIRKADRDKAGRPMHPIAILHGAGNTARVYANAGLSDAVGAYVSAGRPGADGGYDFGIALLDNIEGQINPVSFATLNVTGPLSAGAFRANVYNAIIAGAKGITYWRDGYGEGSRKEFPELPPIDEQPWWPEFPRIRREVDRLLPIIRRPHWTSWRVTASTDALRFGARDDQHTGYIIIQNPGGGSVAAEFRIDGLPYQPSVVKDFLTGATLAPVTANTFRLRMEGYQTRVCLLERSGPSHAAVLHRPACLTSATRTQPFGPARTLPRPKRLAATLRKQEPARREPLRPESAVRARCACPNGAL
ncbi:MAG: sigma-70 family RNA polymerase sigma factor [Kiritimatiellae bacterium]|nr:sigma-70 family RNA polymerase sigma factor [Kiritimatiellia bacterium]